MISSDSDLDMYGKAIAKAGFKARLAFEHSIMFEFFPLYELTQSKYAISLSLTFSSAFLLLKNFDESALPAG